MKKNTNAQENQALSMTNTSNTGVERLLSIMSRLRGADGCPWDAEQTPESLRPYILEEAHEVIEAIDTGNSQKIKEELGDLLLQVVFQTQIFSERGQFDFDNVANAISDKLVRRHPHVFAGQSYSDARDLNTQWDAIKRNERRAKNEDDSILAGICGNLPALMRADKILSRLERGHLPLPANEKLPPQLQQNIEFFLDDPEPQRRLGELLLTIVAAGRSHECNAEIALHDTCAEVSRLATPTKNGDRK